MLLKQLSEEDQRTFLSAAKLLCLSDSPALFDGKPQDQVTANSRSGEITFQRSEHDVDALKNLESLLSPKALGMSSGLFDGSSSKEVENRFARKIGSLPLASVDQPETRAVAAAELLREELNGKTAATPSVPKLMLFELMLLALTEGAISDVRRRLLGEFRHHYQLEDYIYDDLLERARCTHAEAQKTISIILE